MTVHINIGSNKGDRATAINRAVALVTSLSSAPVRVSAPIETSPWGFESPNPFLNIGIEIEWNGTPMSLLSQLQEIERTLEASPHRNETGNYIDRTLDIDIIYIDNLIIDTPELTIPHPRMNLREFVLRPVAELSPQWQHPITNMTAQEMLMQL